MVLARYSPWAYSHAIPLSAIENESFVVRERGSDTRSAIERFFARHWYIMQRKGKRLSPAANEFKTFVLEQANAFIRLPD